jgi:hypothetical protein
LAKVPLDKLMPGMTLSKPVMNKNGMVMLGQGTELTESLIQKIADLDIGSAYVHGYAQPQVPKEEMLAQLDDRFAGVVGEPYMALLKKLLREHVAELYE